MSQNNWAELPYSIKFPPLLFFYYNYRLFKNESFSITANYRDKECIFNFCRIDSYEKNIRNDDLIAITAKSF